MKPILPAKALLARWIFENRQAIAAEIVRNKAHNKDYLQGQLELLDEIEMLFCETKPLC
jgi:hypothetical protein